MSRFNTQVNGIQGVGVGAVATVNMDTKRRYHSLDFTVTDAGAVVDAETAIDLITLKVNGTIIKQLTPKAIKRKNAFYSYPQSTGKLTIYFTEPRRAGFLGDELTSWDLFDESTFTIDVRFKSAGIVTPALFIQQSWDTKRNGEVVNGAFIKYPGAILRELITTQNMSTNFTMTNQFPVGVPIQLIALIPTTPGTVQRVELDVDAVRVFEGDVLASYGFNDPYGSYDDYGLTVDRTATQNFVPVSFDADRKLESALAIQSAQNMRTYLSAAQAVDILTCYRTVNFR